MRFLRFVHRCLVRQTMPRLAARYYDDLIGGIAGFYLEPFRDEIFEAFPGPATVLDVGTGPGQLPVMLAKGNPLYRVIGVDLSEECLRLGREHARDAGVADRVEFIRADLEKLALGMPPADLAVSTCSLHHWRRPVAMLRAISRLVKPSGQIWIFDDSAETSDHARREWIARVEQAARAGWLFRSVFRFESRCLSYGRDELESICERAGLVLTAFDRRAVFFTARMRRKPDPPTKPL